ncbi:hypothetical protein KK062_29615 [Fulvivirgaceae bacterium PWU5]|uniref:Uncharacterized protein n=1 Tax=Dawidia cretensis TaxID=2782350 RepID=A0AAP2GT24_9BACT|nr:hypothetical protein [Dawidia cretensis]MBT1712436.1 hypothetical protein [Dawidia cretensis]
MDLLSAFKSENQRELLIIVLPGSIAIWPYTYLIIRKLNFEPESLLSEWTLIPLILIFLFISWGAGFFLADIAANIEIRLEKIYFTIKTTSKQPKTYFPFSFLDNSTVLLRLTFGWLLILFNRWEMLLGGLIPVRVMDKTSISLRDEFYCRWNQYLSNCIFDNEPILIRYYRAVLNRFKFELTIIAAVAVMVIGHFLLFLIGPSYAIDWTATGTYFVLLTSGTTFLFIEAFKSIELLDHLRAQMISTCAQNGK